MLAIQQCFLVLCSASVQRGGLMKANPSVAPAPIATSHIASAAWDCRITALLSRSWVIKLNQCCLQSGLVREERGAHGK